MSAPVGAFAQKPFCNLNLEKELVMEGVTNCNIVLVGNLLVVPVPCPREKIHPLSVIGSYDGAEVYAVYLSPTCFGLVIRPREDHLEVALFEVLWRIWGHLTEEGMVDVVRPEIARSYPAFLFLNENTELRMASNGVVSVGELPVGRLPVAGDRVENAGAVSTSNHGTNDSGDMLGQVPPLLSAERKHQITDPGII